ETGHGRNDREVRVPYVIGPLRCNSSRRWHRLGRWWRWRDRRAPAHPTNGRGPQMQTGTRQHLLNLDLAQQRTKSLQALHDVVHKVGEFVDRLLNLEKRSGAHFVERSEEHTS